ncbi:MAG: TetR family transcriptional regulator [Burkholderiales bacterium]|nr:TetR family transcriptional regulator [Burkholderiales bacterium]
MPRPSQGIDQALLRSGRVLYPASGCAGLSMRALAEHAGARLSMVHYHFGTKDQFLRTLLQQMYDEGFARLAAPAGAGGPALGRLREALLALGAFLREQRPFAARVWADAAAGEPVARAFVRANAPRHLGLLTGLMQQAEADGALDPMPPLQRFVFVMGAVVAPMFIAPVAADIGVGPAVSARAVQAQVLAESAIADRVDRVLAALGAGRRARVRRIGAAGARKRVPRAPRGASGG